VPKRTDLRKILLIGSGPIVIGQACEFDYSGTQACKALKALGYRVVLINSNPATIMTDPDVADATYIEPLTADFAEQSRIVLEKIRVAVEEPGGSLTKLVKTNVFVKDASMLPIYRGVEQAFFREHAPEVAREPPASTGFIVSELPRPEFLIEVEAFAVAHAAAGGWSTHRQAGTANAAESVTAGRLVFVSACDGGSPSTSIEREVTTALDNLGDALARAGTAFSKIIKITLMLSDVDEYARMQSAVVAYYREHAPQLVAAPAASTFLGVGAMGPGGARFQVDAVAVI